MEDVVGGYNVNGDEGILLVLGFTLNNCSTRSVGDGSSVSLKGVTCLQ